MAEEESKAIGRRVSEALKEKKRRGFFTGCKAPYGYVIQLCDGGKKLALNKQEQKVIKFINKCREVGTSAKRINSLMRRIAPDFDPDEPIVLYFKEQEGKRLVEPLTHQAIADLLNENNVLRRGAVWKANSVRLISKKVYDDVVTEMGKLNFGNFGK